MIRETSPAHPQASSGGGDVASVAGRTGTVVLTKTDVGLSAVDNTADTAKPVSTATTTALALKQDTATLAESVQDIVGTAVVAGSNVTVTYNDAAGTITIASTGGGGGAVDSVNTRTGAVTLTSADVGLGNVTNTSDANKPVSTAQQTALDAKQPLDSDLTTIAGLTATTNNFIVSVGSAWASRTVAQVKTTLSLDAVDNTADSAKPVSTAQATAIALKQDTSTLTESVQDIVGAFVVGGTGITATYSDGSNTLTLSAAGRTEAISWLSDTATIEATPANRAPGARTLTGVRMWVEGTAPTGSSLTIQVQHSTDGTSWSSVGTALSITTGNTAEVSQTFGTPQVQAAGERVRLNVTAVGSTTPATKVRVDVLATV